MPPSNKKGGHPLRREADFSTLLTAAEKHELSSLISKAIESMQDQLSLAFESAGTSNYSQPPRPSYWNQLPPHLRDLSLALDSRHNPSPPADGYPSPSEEDGGDLGGLKMPTGHTRSQSAASDREMPPQSLDEGSGIGSARQDAFPKPILQELKKEFIMSFRKWQISVNRRVNDISVKGGKHTARSSRQPRRGSPGTSAPRLPGLTSSPVVPKTRMTLADENMRRFYPPVPNSLSYLPMEKKKLVLHAMLLLLLSLDHYQAYSRTLMLILASSLHVPIHVVLDDEVRLAKVLADAVKDVKPADLLPRKGEEPKGVRKTRSAMAGADASGSLPASLVAARIGTIPSGLSLGTSATAGILAGVAESALTVAALFGLYVARPSGKPMEQLAKDIPLFGLRPIRSPGREESEFGMIEPEQRRLRVVLAIGGWLLEDDDITKPWYALGDSSEVYALQWDPEALKKMGNALKTVLKSAAWSLAKKEIVARASASRKHAHPENDIHGHTSGSVRGSLDGGCWPDGLLKMSKTIDNPWTLGMVRADKTGHTLAEMISSKMHGERGITLVGYSLGARVIYTCLMSLAEKRAFGLVENAILMGTPAPSGRLVWGTMKSVVSARLVNVYSENDYVLGFLYRMSSLQYGVAGLQRIGGVDGVENVNVTAKVGGHMRYQYLVGSILDCIGWEDIDREVVAADERALATLEEQTRELDERRDAVELSPEGPVVTEAAKEEKQPEGIIRTRIKKKKGRGRK
ncbi:DUF726-domain-containing protein [Thozetella sp. PMI_491]|nr:DUF726-domain-containing protein [Thozetella sp. PMI_491]